jgi:DNA-binding transcriptional MocR family regulator
LRALLAARRETADPAAAPDEILITSGAQQGIDLVLRAFTEPGDGVAVPVPSYHHVFGMLKAHGLQLVPVATRDHAIDLQDLQRALARGARLLYVMPTFHNPTGTTLDQHARQALVDALRRTDVPVLEDEFQRDLRFAGKPLPSLARLDPRGLTVTVRTFSKGLFPGVRLGWLQASPEVIQRLGALKRFGDLESSALLQAALADFVGCGALDRHLEAVRRELRARHEAARRALARAMPAGVRWTEPDGGYVLWLETPGLDADALAAAAAARGVLTTPGRLFDPRSRASAGLRLSLSRPEPAAIERGIDVLGACAGELLRAGTRAGARTLFL